MVVAFGLVLCGIVVLRGVVVQQCGIAKRWSAGVLAECCSLVSGESRVMIEGGGVELKRC